MQPEVLRVQAERIGRAAKAARQSGEIAVLADAEAYRLVLMGQIRASGRGWAEKYPAPRTNLLG